MFVGEGCCCSLTKNALYSSFLYKKEQSQCGEVQGPEQMTVGCGQVIA
jgi:hypothetical protein